MGLFILLSAQESHGSADRRAELDSGSRSLCAFVLGDSCEVGEAADSMAELLKWIQKGRMKVNCAEMKLR